MHRGSSRIFEFGGSMGGLGAYPQKSLKDKYSEVDSDALLNTLGSFKAIGIAWGIFHILPLFFDLDDVITGAPEMISSFIEKSKQIKTGTVLSCGTMTREGKASCFNFIALGLDPLKS